MYEKSISLKLLSDDPNVITNVFYMLLKFYLLIKLGNQNSEFFNTYRMSFIQVRNLNINNKNNKT